jgi:hypothetical protein
MVFEDVYTRTVRRKDLILTLVFLGTFLVTPFLQRDFKNLVEHRRNEQRMTETELEGILGEGKAGGVSKTIRVATGRFKQALPSPEEIKQLESAVIELPPATRIATTLPPPPPYQDRNVTRLTPDYVSQVVPPAIHIYKPTYDKRKDARTADAIEAIEVTKLLQLPKNATYPKVYKRGEIFHIIKTRFMQYQPKLVELGKARLELFKTFCLPSMLHQTSQNFFWLIYTDPELDDYLLEELKKLVRPYPHFYVVPSLIDKRGQGGKDILRKIKPEEFHIGDTDMLFANLKYVHWLAVLESRFDADDALNINYIEEVQNRAHDVFVKDKGGREWMFWCINQAVEWHWVGPGGRQSLQTFGALVISRNYADDNFCHTPGLTVGVARGSFTRTVAKAPHHLLYEMLDQEDPNCGSTYHGVDCLDFITDFNQCALRSRTPTSASMANVNDLNIKVTKLAAEQAVERWTNVIKDFALLPTATKATNVYLKENLRGVLDDARLGQCTEGHSCRDEARGALDELIRIVESGEGEAEGESA